MHKSRLAGFIIDCQTKDLTAAATFWKDALGFKLKVQPDDPAYINFDTGKLDLHVEVQTVDHPSRVHLDIESDDIDAEVTRLEGLGAKKIAKIRTWVVMEAPTGQRFCVVRPQSEDFAEKANVWK